MLRNQRFHCLPSGVWRIALSLLLSLLSLLLSLSVPSSALAQSATESGAVTRNVAVEFEGTGALTSLLNEHVEISRRRKNELGEEEIQRLVGTAPAQISALLATEGYFSPTIQHELDRRSSPWVARFTIEPGPQVHIDSVEITFSGGIADGASADPERIARLRREWSLAPGDAFRQRAWDNAKSALLKNLLINDFPAAAIADSEARIDPVDHTAALSVRIDSGPAFTFGDLQIEGLRRYGRDMIDQANPIRPGEPYSQEKLNELQGRLQDTGYFRSVFATVEVNPEQPLRVPVRLDLTENERKRLALGIGFSTDTGARGSIKWLDRNFLGRNWRLEAETKIDRETRVLGAEVYLPALDNGWLPSFGAHYERTDTSGEINNKLRTGARVTSPDKADEKVWAIAFLADRQRIGEDFSNNREALIGSFTYTRRRVDNLITPTRGYVASIELGAGPPGIVNKKGLVRAVGRATWLSPVRNRFQAVLRGQVGEVFGANRDTVPADLLFLTGGDQTVRGYAYNTLGVAQSGAIVGGTVTAVLSAELVYQVTPQWGAAVFTDAGNAADSWRDFKFSQGSGVGARWRSPIGAVNLDLAYGHETRKPRLHFSIGYGF